MFLLVVIFFIDFVANIVVSVFSDLYVLYPDMITVDIFLIWMLLLKLKYC